MRCFLFALCLLCVAAPAWAQALQPVPPHGFIDWSTMRLHAVGQGFAAEPEGSGLGARMAGRAAVLDARRNLLELFKSVRVDSQTVVRDFMLQDDIAFNRLAGVLTRNALEERHELEAGGVEVRVSAPIGGDVAALLWELYPPKDISLKSLNKESFSQQNAVPTWHVQEPIQRENAPDFTGLIVDARGLDFAPSLRPALYGPEGLLYPGVTTPLELAAREGYVRYFRDMEAAEASGRGGDAPLLVRASGLHQGNVSSLDLPSAAAEALAASPNAPLSRAAVAIVY